jgi:hypothetical protein
MRTILISGVAILLSTAALPATAAPAADRAAAGSDTSQTGSQNEPSAQPRQRARDSDRQICVNEAMSTGRIRRRVCHTQAEWNALQANDDR